MIPGEKTETFSVQQDELQKKLHLWFLKCKMLKYRINEHIWQWHSTKNNPIWMFCFLCLFPCLIHVISV